MDWKKGIDIGIKAVAAGTLVWMLAPDRYEQTLFQEENVLALESILEEKVAQLEALELDESDNYTMCPSHLQTREFSAAHGFLKKELIPYMDAEIDQPIERELHIQDEKPLSQNAMLLLFGFMGLASLGYGVSYARKEKWKEAAASGLSVGLCALGLSLSTQNNGSPAEYSALFDTVSYNKDNTELCAIDNAKILAHESFHATQSGYEFFASDVLAEGFAEKSMYRTMDTYLDDTVYDARAKQSLAEQLVVLHTTYKGMARDLGMPIRHFDVPFEPADDTRDFSKSPHYQGFTLFTIREHQWKEKLTDNVAQGDFCKIRFSPAQRYCD